MGKTNEKNDREALICYSVGPLCAKLHIGKLERRGRDPNDDPKTLG